MAGLDPDEEEDEEEDSGLPNVNVVFVGPCGCGKSTTAGRLIADCNAIDEQSLERIAREARDGGHDERRYAWILDKLREERERGGTIYMALWRLAAKESRLLLIDAPGHSDFAKETVTAMSQADAAVLVVSAVEADLDVGNACEGQIREHTLLAYTLGIRRLVVCVNKMDVEAVAFSQAHFDRAVAVVREDLRKVGFAVGSVTFVPTSGSAGDNVAESSEKMPWYSGPTLLEAVSNLAAAALLGKTRAPGRPLRIPIREVMQIGGTGTVTVGRIETGSLQPGMRLAVQPGGVFTTVQAIQMHHEKIPSAKAGDIVNIHVDIPMKELKRGMVLSNADDSPAQECCSFQAQVIVLSPPRAGEIRAGCSLVIDCHTAQVPCVFETLLSRTDRLTGQVLEMHPAALHAGDAAVVRLRPEAPICVEPFSQYPPLGRFTVRDQKITVAVGVVQEVETDAAPSRTSPIAKAGVSRSKGRDSSAKGSSAKPKVPRSPTKDREAIGHTDRAAAGGRRPSEVFGAKLGADDDGADPEADPDGAEADGEIGSPQLAPKLAPKLPKPLGLASGSQGSPFAAFGAVTPFAAFGAVTRSRAKESKPRSPWPEDGVSGGYPL